MRNSGSSSSLDSGGTGERTRVLKKGPWTAAEDAILVEYVSRHGEGNWNSVQRNCGLARCGKSCRLRWANHLRPNLKKGSFTQEEEMLILHLHAQLGNKWARMAAHLPGRTDNEIKNFWNTRIKRRQRAGLPLYQPDLHVPRHPPIPVPPPSANRFSIPAPSSYDGRYGCLGGDFDLMQSPAGMAMFSPAMMDVKAELPSTQFVFNGGGDSGLLDALLRDDESLRPSNGVNLKRDRPEEMNQPSTQDDISKLFDMISTPGMPAAPDWYTTAAAAAPGSCDISNGVQSTDDELGLELQQLASSLSAASSEQDWNIGSCPWSNMPGIC